MVIPPTVYTNCLSPAINKGLQHPDEVQTRIANGIHGDIDYEVACYECVQHETAMQRAGANVLNLGINQHLPDSVFLQDTAYILQCQYTGSWHAFGGSMGHSARREEVSPVLEQLEQFGLKIHHFPSDLEESIEFGDCFPPMQIDSSRIIFFGRREYDERVPCRTTDRGVSWFRTQVELLGYKFIDFEFSNTLHLTSLGNAVGMTPVQKPLVLIDGSRCSLSEFKRFNIDVPQLSADIRKRYAWGLNTVRLNGSVVMQEGFEPVKDLLFDYGFVSTQILETPWTQLCKRDGSPSCRGIMQTLAI